MERKKLKRMRRVLARVLVRPPTRPSSGAQTINKVLGAASRLSRRNPPPKQYTTIINWGNPTDVNAQPGVTIFNPPAAVRKAIDKVTALQTLLAAGVRVPEFSVTPPAERGKGCIWLARLVTNGSGGAGIRVVREEDAFPAAPLYVKYIRKTEECRVHVAFGKAILVQYKLRKAEGEQTADQKLIRNHDNGWVFAPRHTDAPENYLATAVAAVEALGLDFGAVDMVVSKKDGEPYVLEVNTAPGLEGESTIAAWTKAFKEELGVV